MQNRGEGEEGRGGANAEKRKGCGRWRKVRGDDCRLAQVAALNPYAFFSKYDACARLRFPFPPFASLHRNNLTMRNKTAAGCLFECSFVRKEGQ